MARWFASQSPLTLLVLRLLLVSNVGLLAAVGGIALAFVARPAGYAFAGACWGASAALAALIRYTNPRRYDDSRW
jgi:hypothetical protein